jgi:hypothetical protein
MPRRPGRRPSRKTTTSSRRSITDQTPAQRLKKPQFEKDIGSSVLQEELSTVKRKYRDVLQELQRERARQKFLEDLPPPRPRKFKPRPKVGAKGDACAILVCCDWHAEQVVTPEMVEGRNEHNVEIFRKRNARLWPGALRMFEFMSNLSRIDEFGVLFLGDLFTNHLHEEDMENNELGPSEAYCEVRDAIAGGLEFLSEHLNVKKLWSIMMSGNHPRMTPRMKVHKAYTSSLEYILGREFEFWHRKAEMPIEWTVPKGETHIFEVKGHDIRGQHGYPIRYHGGTGGVAIPLNRTLDGLNSSRPVALDLVAHFHQTIIQVQRRSIVCPSHIGFDGYAQFCRARYEPPSQMMVIMDRHDGLVQQSRVHIE